MKYFIFLTLIFASFYSLAQMAETPLVESKTTKDVYIHSVSSKNETTDIIFVYFNTGKSHYIYLNPPGHEDALFLKANGIKYKLLSTDEIASETGITIAHSLTCVYFSASFEKLPASTSSFDLIEGNSGTWNFQGIQLDAPTPKTIRFRRDYKFMTPMKEGSRGASIPTQTYFVFNVNSNNDINIYFKESGKKITLNVLGAISESSADGNNYQTVKALDDEGAEIELKIFDDPLNGVYMVFSKGNVIQYHN